MSHGGVYAFIPARRGSKRVARKNLEMIAGKPLIAYTVETALESGVFDHVMVNSEDSEILALALELFQAPVGSFQVRPDVSQNGGAVCHLRASPGDPPTQLLAGGLQEGDQKLFALLLGLPLGGQHAILALQLLNMAGQLLRISLLRLAIERRAQLDAQQTRLAASAPSDTQGIRTQRVGQSTEQQVELAWLNRDVALARDMGLIGIHRSGDNRRF